MKIIKRNHYYFSRYEKEMENSWYQPGLRSRFPIHLHSDYTTDEPLEIAALMVRSGNINYPCATEFYVHICRNSWKPKESISVMPALSVTCWKKPSADKPCVWFSNKFMGAMINAAFAGRFEEIQAEETNFAENVLLLPNR